MSPRLYALGDQAAHSRVEGRLAIFGAGNAHKGQDANAVGPLAGPPEAGRSES